MGKIEFEVKMVLGKCLDFLERKPVTADTISLVGWCAIGSVFPAISAVAITGSFVSMGIMLAQERKGSVDHEVGKVLDLVVSWCSLLWYAPVIVACAAWYLIQSTGERAGACA